MHYSKKILNNGLRIITAPIKDAQSATFLIMADTGSKYESKEESGLAHFIEHVLFKGTKNRPSSFHITQELDSIGSHYNAFTSQEYTGYYAKTAPEFFDTAIEVISDLYLNPLFDANEIEKEKGVIIEELRMYRDMPQQQVQDIFMDLLYGDTPAGRPIIGSEETIRSFSHEHFVNYFEKKYNPHSTIITVVGNFDEKECIHKIEELFSAQTTRDKASKESVVEKQSTPAVAIFEKETDQTHIVLGFRTYGIGNTENTILKMLSGILSAGMSSRLFMKLREEMGACYYVHASNDVYTDHGVFQIAAGIDSKRLNEIITVLLSECKKLVTTLVSDEELQRTKNNIIGSSSLSLESSDALANFFAVQEAQKGNIESFEEIEQKIKAVTKEDIQRVAQLIFVEKTVNLAVVGKGYAKEAIYPLLKI
jgi:predicted Zn-dependent peptidase